MVQQLEMAPVAFVKTMKCNELDLRMSNEEIVMLQDPIKKIEAGFVKLVSFILIIIIIIINLYTLY